METDLSVLVDAIAGAARKVGCGPQPSPWLPPLPESITLDDAPPCLYKAEARRRPAARCRRCRSASRTSRPGRRASRWPWTSPYGGHIVVAGAARSGRSTVLRTIAGSIAARESAADVHIYAIDCGTGSLLPLAGLPHCGAVVTRDQTDRVERLIGKLRGEIGRRQQLLAASGFAGLAEQRAAAADPAQRLPWMVLLLDWWEGSSPRSRIRHGQAGGHPAPGAARGRRVGLRAVVTTDRMAMIGQVGTVFGHGWCSGSTTERRTLAGIGKRSCRQPANGRMMIQGSRTRSRRRSRCSTPMPPGPPRWPRCGDRRRGTQRYGRLPKGHRPLRVDPLPPRITVDETCGSPGLRPPSPLWALAGAGGDELSPQGLDVVEEGPGLMIAGPPRSGAVDHAADDGAVADRAATPVLVVTPRRSPLRSWRAGRGDAVLGADIEVDDSGHGQPDGTVRGDRGRRGDAVQRAEAEMLEKLLVSGRDGEHGLIIAG